MKYSNFRGIVLTNTTYKILSKILLGRLSPLVTACIGDYQCVFRRSILTVDQIFPIRQKLEKIWEFNQDLLYLFIDFGQAYGSLIHFEHWNIMPELSKPQKLVELMKEYFVDTRS